MYYAALNFNATIRYECNYGFKLNGPEVRRCDQNKQWSAISSFVSDQSPVPVQSATGSQSTPGGNLNPICKQIDCGSPGNLPNGFLEGRKTTLGSVITFRCFDETTFVGTTNSTTCTESGKWSHPLPNCLAPCVVPLIENGRINSAAAGSKLPHASTIEAICKPQYESAVSNTTVSMCNNGSWTVIPFCVPGEYSYSCALQLTRYTFSFHLIHFSPQFFRTFTLFSSEGEGRHCCVNLFPVQNPHPSLRRRILFFPASWHDSVPRKKNRIFVRVLVVFQCIFSILFPFPSVSLSLSLSHFGSFLFKGTRKKKVRKYVLELLTG